jgi:hypothetical protein
MGLLLAVAFAAQFPTDSSPRVIGVHHGQLLLAGSEAEALPGGSCWASSAGATVAQSACGLGSGVLMAGTGLMLMMGGIVHEDWDNARAGMVVTAALVPAATATGVVLAGRGRGRAGNAYLGSYVGAVALGAIGFLADGDRMSGSGLAIGLALGSVPGAVVGYNLGRPSPAMRSSVPSRFELPVLSLEHARCEEGNASTTVNLRLVTVRL